MPKISKCTVFLVLIIISTEGAARSGERLALLIGNESYNSAVGLLKNPHNDVDLIETSLKSIGFKVTKLKTRTSP